MRGLFAAAVVAAWGWSAAPGIAHETAGTITPVIDGFVPEVGSDVETFVQSSQDATLLTVVPAAGVEVELLDDDGGTWAVVTSGGVTVDLGNPAYHAATNPRGAVPSSLPASTGPTTVASDDGRFQWFEHRLHPEGFVVDPDVLASDVEQDVSSWAVPVRVDGAATELTGRLRHVPVRGSLVPRLVEGREVADGVTLDVVPGSVPGLFLASEAAVPVTVLSRDGAPYLVLDDAGARVNVASATWADQVRFGNVASEAVVVEDGPVYEQLSTTATHTWLDARAALPGVVPAAEVRASTSETVVREWSIPLEVGDEVVVVAGETVWVPFTDDAGAETTSSLRWDLVVAAVVAGALLLLVGLRRRRGGDV